MLATRTHHLLEINELQFKAIKRTYKISEDALNRDIDALILWFKMQPHLPNVILDRAMVANLYIMNKCSIERTKERLDMRFMSKVLLPEFFTNRDTLLPSIQNAFRGLGFSPMKNLCPDNVRLSILKFIDPDPELFDFIQFFKVVFMVGEKRIHHDCAIGDRLLVDLKGASLRHLCKINPNDIRKAELANKKVFGGKLIGIHIINGPSFIEKLLSLLRLSLQKKLAERIKVHPTIDDLYKHIPKEILPKDYDGPNQYFAEIVEEWRQELANEEFHRHFLAQDKLTSNESKRPASHTFHDFAGIQGSFKKLEID